MSISRINQINSHAHEVYDLKNQNNLVSNLGNGQFAIRNPQPQNLLKSVTFNGFNFKQKTYTALQSFSALKLIPKIYNYARSTGLVTPYTGARTACWYNENAGAPTVPFRKRLDEFILPVLTKDNLGDLVVEINRTIEEWWKQMRTIYYGFKIHIDDLVGSPSDIWESAYDVTGGGAWLVIRTDSPYFPIDNPVFIDSDLSIKNQSIVCYKDAASDFYLVVWDLSMVESLNGQILYNSIPGYSQFFEANATNIPINEFAYPLFHLTTTNAFYVTELYHWWVENYKYAVNSDEKPNYFLLCNKSRGNSKIIFTGNTDVITEINEIVTGQADDQLLIKVISQNTLAGYDPADDVKMLSMSLMITWNYGD